MKSMGLEYLAVAIPRIISVEPPIAIVYMEL